MTIPERAAWLYREVHILAETISANENDLVAVKFGLKSLIFEAQKLHEQVNEQLDSTRHFRRNNADDPRTIL